MDFTWDGVPRPRPEPQLATPVKRVNRQERPSPPKASHSQPSRPSPPNTSRSKTLDRALLKKLQKLLPLDPGEPEHGSWLSFDPMGKPRCLACEDFIASSAKLANLQRHGTCATHVSNAAVPRASRIEKFQSEKKLWIFQKSTHKSIDLLIVFFQ